MSLQEMFERKNDNKCPFCGRDMSDAKFRDELSEREFRISGLCQKCQDEIF